VATYFTNDFADFTTCSDADCGDWTKRYRTDQTWTPADDIVQAAAPASDWAALTWDDIDADAGRAEIELLCLITSPAVFSARSYPVIVLGSGADESATHYSIALFSSSFRTYICNGADTPTQIATTATFACSTSTDYWIRFRVSPANDTIQAKIWRASDSEPSGWSATDQSTYAILSSTNSTLSSAGWVGLANYSAGAAVTYKQFGVGTNGDTAPSSGSATLVGYWGINA
jgi:hypothetical protein